MKLLISGTTGFIGKHLVTRLLKEQYKILAIIRPSTKLNRPENGIQYYSFDGNITNLIAFMEKEHFDGVIHLASLFLVQHKPEDTPELVNSNILFATSLLEAATKSGVPWFINTGTFWQHYQNKNYSPVNLYAATKQAFEVIAQYYTETSPINFVTIKLSDTFGPRDTRPKIFNLWSRIGQTGETLHMSTGKQLIDINYIDDVVGGYLTMINLLTKDIKHRLNGESFVISSKERMTLKKLASLFEKTTKAKLNINWGGREYRLREVMIPWEKGKNIPGWEPRVSVEEGIKLTFKK